MNTKSTLLLKEAAALRQSISIIRDAALRDAVGKPHKQTFIRHMLAVEIAVLERCKLLEQTALGEKEYSRRVAQRNGSGLTPRESVNLAAERAWGVEEYQRLLKEADTA